MHYIDDSVRYPPISRSGVISIPAIIGGHEHYDRLLFNRIRIPASFSHLLEMLSGGAIEYKDIVSSREKIDQVGDFLLRAWAVGVNAYVRLDDSLMYPESGLYQDVDKWIIDVDDKTGIISSIQAVLSGIPEEDVFI